MNKTAIAILGGGTAGWITAAILAKGLPADKFDINLIESQAIPSVGVGEATIPPIVKLLAFLDINEGEFLKHLDGTYKYGIQFEDWAELGNQYMHAFGDIGTSFDTLPFHQAWLKSAHTLGLSELGSFIPSAVAANAGKYHPPVAVPCGANPSHFYPLSLLFYAYQFDAGKLADFLKDYACSRRVRHVEGKVSRINNKPDGDICSLTLSDKQKINADYFIDCSGTAGLINKTHFGCPFEKWHDELPCDSAVVAQTTRTTSPAPFTRSIAMPAGWRWEIPLRHRNGNGYVYAKRFTSDEQALETFTRALEGQTLITDPKVLRFETGCLKTPWFRNSIAVGLAAGFLEPLESTSIHLIHKFAMTLKDSFLLGTDMVKEAEQFNKQFYEEALSIKDFLTLHYHVNRREDTPFWTYCRHMPISNTLRQYLAEFSKTGHITLPQNSLFPFESWFQILVGQGYLRDYARFSDHRVTASNAKTFFTNVKLAIQSEISRLATHQSYLQQ